MWRWWPVSEFRPQRPGELPLAGRRRPGALRPRRPRGEMRPLSSAPATPAATGATGSQTEDGNPLYFGGADELQLRARGWRPLGHAPLRQRLRDDQHGRRPPDQAREAINSAFISVTGPAEPEADAGPPRPGIVTRAEWGATRDRAAASRAPPRSWATVKAAVIHHTVTANTYRPQEAPGIVLGICRYHRNANGWNDIGYQALVDRFGTLYAGRAGGLKQADRRRPGAGLQRPDDGDRLDRRPHQGPDQPRGEGLDRRLPRLEAVDRRPEAAGQDDAGLRRRRPQPLPQGRRVPPHEGLRTRTLGLTACPGSAPRARDVARSADGPARDRAAAAAPTDRRSHRRRPGPTRPAGPAAQAAASPLTRGRPGRIRPRRPARGGQALVLGAVADDLVRADRQLGVGEAALERLEPVARGASRRPG